jgi:hypothetical protein
MHFFGSVWIKLGARDVHKNAVSDGEFRAKSTQWEIVLYFGAQVN